jgi:PDZ domain
MPDWFSLRFLAARLLLGFSLLQVCPAQVPSEILKQLASPDFKVREKAEADMTEWASADREAAYDMLYQHAKEHPEAEVRVRCLAVLRRFVTKIYDSEGEGYMGIRMMDEAMILPDQAEAVAGLRVVEVVPDAPAAKSGILVGDFIVAFNNAGWKQLPASNDFRAQVKSFKPFSVITLKVLRDGKLQEVQISLARRPAAADHFFQFGDMDEINAAEEALREEHFKKWLLDRNKDR